MCNDPALDEAVYELYRLVKPWIAEVEKMRSHWMDLSPRKSTLSVGAQLVNIIEQADEVDCILTDNYREYRRSEADCIDKLFNEKKDEV